MGPPALSRWQDAELQDVGWLVKGIDKLVDLEERSLRFMSVVVGFGCRVLWLLDYVGLSILVHTSLLFEKEEPPAVLEKPLPGATYYLSSLHSGYTVQVVSFKTRLSQLLLFAYVVFPHGIIQDCSCDPLQGRKFFFLPEVRSLRTDPSH